MCVHAKSTTHRPNDLQKDKGSRKHWWVIDWGGVSNPTYFVLITNTIIPLLSPKAVSTKIPYTYEFRA